MKIAVFSTKAFERPFLEEANSKFKHELCFLEPALAINTCILAADFKTVCTFVNDDLSKPVLEKLAQQGTQLIALRCAGFNNVDLGAAQQLGLTVVRVPAYSPYAVAEHTVSLILALNRKIHRAYNRVREGNFSLDGLLGFDLKGRTVGIIGTGRIGTIVAKIMTGFGCHILGYDTYPNDDCKALGLHYVSLEELLRKSDIITLHCPLTPETHHLINAERLRHIKNGLMLINTSRGALIDTQAVIESLKSGKIRYLGLDVYEEEAHLFFQDLSNNIIQDDVFARLLTFPNVIITGHQAFFTREALQHISEITLKNIHDFEQGKTLSNEISFEQHVK